MAPTGRGGRMRGKAGLENVGTCRDGENQRVGKAREKGCITNGDMEEEKVGTVERKREREWMQ